MNDRQIGYAKVLVAMFRLMDPCVVEGTTEREEDL